MGMYGDFFLTEFVESQYSSLHEINIAVAHYWCAGAILKVSGIGMQPKNE